MFAKFAVEEGQANAAIMLKRVVKFIDHSRGQQRLSCPRNTRAKQGALIQHQRVNPLPETVCLKKPLTCSFLAITKQISLRFGGIYRAKPFKYALYLFLVLVSDETVDCILCGLDEILCLKGGMTVID